MQSISYFAVFLFVSSISAVLSAITSPSVPTTTPETSVNITSSSTPSVPESDTTSNDHNADNKTTTPTRPPIADQPKSTPPPLIHDTSSVVSSKPSTALSSKPSIIPSDATEPMVGSNGSNSPMSDKKDANSGVSRVNIGFAIVSVVALLISGTFS